MPVVTTEQQLHDLPSLQSVPPGVQRKIVSRGTSEAERIGTAAKLIISAMIDLCASMM